MCKQDIERKRRDIERKKTAIEAQIVALRSQLEAEKDDLDRILAEEKQRDETLASENLDMVKVRQADTTTGLPTRDGKTGKGNRK